jgi:hypothetical protein
MCMLPQLGGGMGFCPSAGYGELSGSRNLREMKNHDTEW